MLRLLADADLDTPAETDPAAAAVVQPYRWLLRRIGDGVRLTQAGYLPPSLVTETMTSLGWDRDWIGKHNREDMTFPVLDLRESAQRLGLLRKNRGQLLVTKAGRILVDDPVEGWWHLASRLLSTPTESERHAGVLYLLSVAAGRPGDHALLAEGMTTLGWQLPGASPSMAETSAFAAARDTWVVFRRLGVLSGGKWPGGAQGPPSPSAVMLARAALLGRAQRPAVVAAPAGGRAVELTISLRDISPPVWRRMVVPASLTLSDLHHVIQDAMGWQDCHLHLFDIDGVLYGDIDEIEGRELGEEVACTVGQVADAVRDFSYEYDFGDSWHHDLHVEQVIASAGSGTPHVVSGARACPPEDCGGSWGYQRLTAVLADPSDEEFDHLLSWVGDGWDPERFHLAQTNAVLALYDLHARRRRNRG